MEHISSTSNEKIKAVKKLHQKKYREAARLFIAEGENILIDLPLTAKVKQLFVVDRNIDAYKHILKRYNADCYSVSDVVMNALSDTETPSGILAVIESVRSTSSGKNALILEGISDCGNLGTIIRTAVGADFPDIYLINCADVYSPKTVRASMGGVLRANLINSDWTNIVEHLKNYTKIAMDMSGENIFGYKPKNKIALIMGNEAHGLSDTAKQLSDITLSIPMLNGQESLNVAVAAGVAMYVINNNLSI